MKPEVNCYYRHRYGGLYKVQDISLSTVDQSKWVVYSHCYPFEYQTWHRPYDEFVDGRFTRLSSEEYTEHIQQPAKDLQVEISARRFAAKGK